MHLISRITVITSSLLGLSAHSSYAQPQAVQDQVTTLIPKPVPTSPNISSLGKFGDYGISHFTGLPAISIPIFEATSGGLKVPIVLNYHALTLKPTDVPGWVGAGWSLSAGGQISRTIRGQADEGHYLNNALESDPSVCGTFMYLKDLAEGGMDGDPDVYGYSYPGGSGKFMKLYGNNYYLIPYAPVRIANDLSITGVDGTLYKFGTGTYGNAYEYTYAVNGSTNSSGTTAWYLMDMVAANSSDKILFEYQEVGSAESYDISYSVAVMDQCEVSNGASCPTSTYAPSAQIHSSAVSQKGVKKIYFDGGTVEFNLGSNRADWLADELKPLDNIVVKDISGATQKTIKFNYDYFKTADSVNYSLKLNSVQFKDASGNVIQQYKFRYFTNALPWSTATNYLYARDKWGYYNGVTSNTDLIVQQNVTFESGGSSSSVQIGGATNREVNTTFAKHGVLSRIDFPTGGYTEFDYESNKYYDNGEKFAPGLRVTKISSYDGLGSPPVVKTYRYGENESGYGIPNWTQLEYNYMNTSWVWAANCTSSEPYVTYRVRTYQSNTAFSLDGFDGAPLRYNYVAEYTGDAAGSHAGRTVYIYDAGNSAVDVLQSVANSSKNYRDSHAWKRGKLTSQTTYDAAGNKLMEKTVSYSTLQTSDVYVGIAAHRFNLGTYGVICIGGSSCGPPDSYSATTFSFSKFFQHSGVVVEANTVEKIYQNGSETLYVQKNTTNTYDPDKIQVTQTSTTRSVGESMVTVNRYPFQLAANATSTGAARGIYLLNEKNVLNVPIETYNYVSKGSSEVLVSGQLTTYLQSSSNSNHVLPSDIYVWVASSQDSKTTTVVNSNNDGLTMDARYVPAKSRVSLTNYDPFGNLLQASRTGDVCTSYKYGYGNTLPVAEVTNAQNTFFLINSTSNVNVNVSAAPPATTANNNYNFTIEYEGPVTLKLAQSSGSDSWSAGYTLTKNGAQVLSSASIPITVGTCGATTVVTTDPLAAGSYTLNVAVTNTSGQGLNACGSITYPTLSSSGFTEFFLENFEEGSGNATTTPHTGLGYYSGDYTVNYTKPTSRDYIVEYWYLDGSSWKQIVKPYTGSSMVLNEGSAIDDVRIYPVDARMKSYTYHTINGMTSSIDERGQTLIYEYDSFGRLKRLRNDRGDIEKEYSYHYKGPN